MALIKVRNKQTKAIAHVSEEWLERWPDDYVRVTENPPKETKPATGTNKKESSK